MNFVEYLIENYIWLLAIVVVIIITIIGFIADRRSAKKRKKKEVGKVPVNNEPVIETVSVELESEASTTPNNTESVVPEFVMGPEVPNQVNIEQNDRIDEIKVEEPIEVVEEPLPENPSFTVLDNPAEINNNVVPEFPSMPQMAVETPVEMSATPTFEPVVETPVQSGITNTEEPIIPMVPLIEPAPAFDLNPAPVLENKPEIPVVNEAPVLNSWNVPVDDTSAVLEPQPMIETPVVNIPVEPIPSVIIPIEESTPVFDLNSTPMVETPIVNVHVGPDPIVTVPVIEPTVSNQASTEEVETADGQGNDVWKL